MPARTVFCGTQTARTGGGEQLPLLGDVPKKFYRKKETDEQGLLRLLRIFICFNKTLLHIGKNRREELAVSYPALPLLERKYFSRVDYDAQMQPKQIAFHL